MDIAIAPVVERRLGALPASAEFLRRLDLTGIIDELCPVRDVAHVTQGAGFLWFKFNGNLQAVDIDALLGEDPGLTQGLIDLVASQVSEGVTGYAEAPLR
ncbi:hypothetical protein ACIQU6_44240 [Streptomyces sp. NPDC090442]|uniref:hypothetical protein n=1 Tax=Streptomyces sp. NPDC090442 TaxID=3365962 RepID=UPI00380C461A